VERQGGRTNWRGAGLKNLGSIKSISLKPHTISMSGYLSPPSGAERSGASSTSTSFLTMFSYIHSFVCVYVAVRAVVTLVLFEVIFFWRVCEKKEILFRGMLRVRNKIMQSSFSNFHSYKG